MAQAQIIFLNRDLDFPIWLKNADGSAYAIPGGATYRLRVFSKPGTAVIDLVWGAGIALGDAPTGRLDVAAGLLVSPTEEFLYASAELIRTDTGADVIATWTVQIVKEGTVPFSPPGAITIGLNGSVTITSNSGFGGPAGAAGAAGPSTLVSGMVPLYPNGDFSQWSKGLGPFTAASIICDGVRFAPGVGATHSLTRIAGLSFPTEYALEWNRTVAGSGTGFLSFALENLRQFHAKTVTVAFEVASAASLVFSSRAQLNYGTGGDATTTQNQAQTTASGSLQTVTRAFAIDLTGKTLGPDSYLNFQIFRTNTQDNGQLRIQNLRAFLGATDYGLPAIDPGMRRMMLNRRLRTIATRTINGTTRVFFGSQMRAVPAVTASVGSITNITADSCDLTHGSAADTVLTIDAEI